MQLQEKQPQNPADIMKYESTLPEDFDGVFRFTNWSKEDFIGLWGGKEYHFPALSTSPMVIPEHSPLEVQNIRKKFAQDLAEREFFKTARYEKIRQREGNRDELGMIQARGYGMSHAGTYSLNDLAPFIQKSLEPLPVAKAVRTDVAKVKIEDINSRTDSGERVTEVVDQKTSLRQKALNA